jgi:membrane associated rhomboid family serine protease
MPPTLIIGEVELEREQTRGKLAFALFFLLTIATVFAFVLIISKPSITSDNVTTFVTGIFTPLIALVSGASGFYFGTKHPDSP